MKKVITTITLAVVMAFGTTFANGGIIMSGLTGNGSCTQTQEKDGIIVAGLTGIGIIVAGLTGIIVAGAVDTEPCTTSDRDGIIVAG